MLCGLRFWGAAGHDISKSLSAFFFFFSSLFFSLLVRHISDTFRPFISSSISLRQFAGGCFFFFFSQRGMKINRRGSMWRITHWNTWSSHFNNIDVTMETSSQDERGYAYLLTKGFLISLPACYDIPQQRRSLYLLLPAMIPSSFFLYAQIV